MVSLYFRGVKDGTSRANLRWEVQVAKQYAQSAAREATVKAQNAQLQTYVQTLTEAEAHESARVDRLTRSILGSVQARDTRPPAVGADSGRGPASGGSVRFGTGAELYREDSEFLIGEAARADQIRAALRTCTAQYHAVRHALASVDTLP
jgi:hypothetical protein